MPQQSKVGSHKTTIATGEDNMIVVTYHSTQVVRFNDARIELDTGGYFTSTTKTRMNQASKQYNLGYSVYQQAGKWFVSYGDRGKIPFDGETLILTRLTAIH